MEDWQQLYQFAQSVLIGVIFSFLLAKLISVVVSFREENLSIVRGEPEASPSESEPIRDRSGDDSDAPSGEKGGGSPSESALTGGDQDSVEDDDDDDDWEGVESTELDEAFSAATAFVAAAAADRLSHRVSNDVQLQLYGLYKIATEGPCTVPQPSALKMTSRAKWQAWQKLGAMPPEEAMQKYIAIVTELYPTWASGSTSKTKGGDSSDAPIGDNKGPMGPVFSMFVYEEESGNELKMDAIHAFAREGDGENLLKYSEGRTPLHWAVDRGHLDITELLVSKNADVNAKDNEGQGPLHYAAVCEREAIAEFLVKQNANTDLKDSDGNTPLDLCDKNWPCLQCAAA